MCDRKGNSILVIQVVKSILLNLFIYHNPGCYNLSPFKKRNALVSPQDYYPCQCESSMTPHSSGFGSDTTYNVRPLTANGPPKPAHLACESHPVRRTAITFLRLKIIVYMHSPHDISSCFGLTRMIYGIIHLSFHYSSSSTLNLGVLNGCATENVTALW